MKELIRSLLDISFAQHLGYTIKLLAIAKRKPEEQKPGAPHLYPQRASFSISKRCLQRSFCAGDAVGELMFYGRSWRSTHQ